MTRNTTGQSTGRIDKTAPMNWRMRRYLHKQAVERKVAEMEQDIATVNTLYESYRQQFTQLKRADPESPRLAALNIIMNKLAMAVNDCNQARNKLKGTARNFC